MGTLINVDNGGTLTDVCVIADGKVFRTKTLTTPYDLSECFFEGMRLASREVLGREDVETLLRGADLIRYSTTQGTNALVERKGQRLGLVVDDEQLIAALPDTEAAQDLLDALVAERARRVDPSLDDEAFDRALVRAVNELTAAGANRIVVSFPGRDSTAREQRAERILLQRFPLHLLGTVPLLFAHELTDDPDPARRTWTALLNAFLHPAMEQFLYAAQRRLQKFKGRAPLLIFRNDGGSARIAKTIAIRTCGSGPRGGMEGVRALARHYGFEELVSADVGGTTTDVGTVSGGEIRHLRRGTIEGVAISNPLADVKSVGVGGSSVIRVQAGTLEVGPQSVGSVPGPACFGRGGREATITDAFLLMGILDPRTFFGGGLELDAERSRAAVLANIAVPLGRPLDEALVAMEEAWARKIAEGIRRSAPISDRTVLAAFGGAGALAVCRVAELVGIHRVVLPGLASVFSAIGIGFSDLAQEYEAQIRERTPGALDTLLRTLRKRAERDMFAERVSPEECTIETSIVGTADGRETTFPYAPGDGVAGDVAGLEDLGLRLRVAKRLEHVSLVPVGGERPSPATASGTRRAHLAGRWRDLPVYRIHEQAPGAHAEGPAIFEEPFLTGTVLPGWRFELTANRDVLLARA